MKVISDTSPLVKLAGVGLIDQLHALFEQVMIPPAVAEEIARDARFAALLPDSLRVCKQQGTRVLHPIRAQPK